MLLTKEQKSFVKLQLSCFLANKVQNSREFQTNETSIFDNRLINSRQSA